MAARKKATRKKAAKRKAVKPRRLSKAGREAISAAATKRWKTYRRANGLPAKGRKRA